MISTDHLQELSDDQWFAFVAEFAAVREFASPNLQRLIREQLTPLVAEVNRQRWDEAKRSLA